MKNRNPIAVALLPLVTFGIYSLFWLIDTGKELKAKEYEIKPFWWLFAPYGAWITATLLVMVGSVTHSASVTGLGLFVSLIAILASLGITLYWYYIYAKAVEGVTNGKLNTVITLIMFYFLGSIGMAIVQDTFNKLGQADMPPADPAAAPPTTPAPPTNPVPPTVTPPTPGAV